MSNRTSIQLPLPTDGTTIEIPLTRGYVAVVDAVDSDLLEQNWHALVSQSDRCVYAKRTMGGHGREKPKYMHIIILERILGRELCEDDLADHVDTNSLNNRRSNLRLATYSENSWNSSKRSDNHSGFKGVYWKKGHRKWVATIMVHGKRKHLGYFDNPEEAHAAYCAAANELHGEFARFE